MKKHYRYVEWDENNLWKNEIKHGVTAEEIEQCFNNPPFVIFPHKKHSDRLVLLGQTFGGRYLFIVYQHKSKEIVRTGHARDMKKSDKEIYEKQTR
ncbi:BrnT family toxin [Thermodesulfobacteriota bacterium]